MRGTNHFYHLSPHMNTTMNAMLRFGNRKRWRCKFECCLASPSERRHRIVYVKSGEFCFWYGFGQHYGRVRQCVGGHEVNGSFATKHNHKKRLTIYEEWFKCRAVYFKLRPKRTHRSHLWMDNYGRSQYICIRYAEICAIVEFKEVSEHEGGG